MTLEPDAAEPRPQTHPRARATARRVKGISGSEFARRRGVSKQQVHDEDRAGKIVRWPDGSIDEQASLIRLESMRDPTRGGRRSEATTSPLPDLGDGSEPAPTALGSPGQVLLKARAAHETLKAQLAKLKLDLAEGRILPRADVERTWYEEVRRVRDGLLSSCADIAGAAIGAGGDLRTVEEAVHAALERTLLALAEEPATRTATGAEPTPLELGGGGNSSRPEEGAEG